MNRNVWSTGRTGRTTAAASSRAMTTSTNQSRTLTSTSSYQSSFASRAVTNTSRSGFASKAVSNTSRSGFVSRGPSNISQRTNGRGMSGTLTTARPESLIRVPATTRNLTLPMPGLNIQSTSRISASSRLRPPMGPPRGSGNLASALTGRSRPFRESNPRLAGNPAFGPSSIQNPIHNQQRNRILQRPTQHLTVQDLPSAYTSRNRVAIANRASARANNRAPPLPQLVQPIIVLSSEEFAGILERAVPLGKGAAGDAVKYFGLEDESRVPRPRIEGRQSLSTRADYECIRNTIDLGLSSAATSRTESSIREMFQTPSPRKPHVSQESYSLPDPKYKSQLYYLELEDQIKERQVTDAARKEKERLEDEKLDKHIEEIREVQRKEKEYEESWLKDRIEANKAKVVHVPLPKDL